jgi:hypothetical protein
LPSRAAQAAANRVTNSCTSASVIDGLHDFRCEGR